MDTIDASVLHHYRSRDRRAETMLFDLPERLDRQRYTPMVISLTTTGDIGPRIADFGIPVQALGMSPGLARAEIAHRLRGSVDRGRFVDAYLRTCRGAS